VVYKYIMYMEHFALLHISLNLKLKVTLVLFLYFQRGFDSEHLGNIFSHAILGNSLVAIASGIIAQYFADMFGFV